MEEPSNPKEKSHIASTHEPIDELAATLGKEFTHIDWVDSKEEEEEEMIDYDTDVYFTDPEEFVPRGDVSGSSHVSDAEAELDVGVATTAPPLVAKPSVARHLVSVVESTKSKGDVPISPFPQGDKMDIPLSSDPQIERKPTVITERPIGPCVEIANVEIKSVHIKSTVMHIKPMAMHIEPTAAPTMTALITQCSEPLVVLTTVALDITALRAFGCNNSHFLHFNRHFEYFGFTCFIFYAGRRAAENSVN